MIQSKTCHLGVSPPSLPHTRSHIRRKVWQAVFSKTHFSFSLCKSYMTIDITQTYLTRASGTITPSNYSNLKLTYTEVIPLRSFWNIMFSGTLVKHSIGCMRQESEIKRQQEGGWKHRGNWIMPLVGGNELSFFSISFTICFYLVINESSVWWQQAVGCLLAVALSSHAACQTSLCFLHTQMQMQPATRTQHMHTSAHSHIEKHFIHTVSCAYFLLCYTLQ